VIITVGSKNPVKIQAVKEIVKNYDFLGKAEIVGVDVEVDLYGHPKSLESTIEGAIDRAEKAFNRNSTYSIGLESGLMAVPKSKSGFMDVCVCAIYDGETSHLGISSAFEYPSKIMELIINRGLDGSQAVKEAGLSSHPKLGEGEGIIHLLTKGKINRKEHTMQALMMAIIHLQNPELY
jgi:inosine/xanthosine triphosphatase